MTRESAGIPTICRTLITATANDAIIAAQAMAPDSPFDRCRPIVALTRNPMSGNRGIRASTSSPLQQGEGVWVERLAVTEQPNHDRESDRRFCGRHGHHEEDDDLAVDVAVLPRECDEREVHGVQHDLDGEQNRDQVAAQKDACGPDCEQNRRDDQIVAERNHPSSPSRCASTTAPIIATRIKIDVASNAKTYSVKSVRPTARTELIVSASTLPATGTSAPPVLRRAHASCTTRSNANKAPKRATPGCRSGWVRSHSAASSCGAFSSMTTNRKSTMMAPA